MKIRKIIFALGMLICIQTKAQELPLFDKEDVQVEKDWLIEKTNAKAKVFQTEEGYLVFTNGIISRTFTLSPNVASVGLDLLSESKSFLRSVRPEAEVEIDGIKFEVGGLEGQTIHNYLNPEWIKEMNTNPGSFKFVEYHVEEIKERFPWKKRLEWMPEDIAWPPAGKELVFSYELDQKAIEELVLNTIESNNQVELFYDDFKTLNDHWILYESEKNPENSFINEGKAGEIMAFENNAVFADVVAPKRTQICIAKIDPGTDKSVSWGPGLGLVFNDRVIKLNLRTKENKFGFFDGEKEILNSEMRESKAVWLKMEILKDVVHAYFSYDQKSWKLVGSSGLSENEKPEFIRLGKMDWSGGKSDHGVSGSRGRCKIEWISITGNGKEKDELISDNKFRYLSDVQVNVHYEIYDNMPVISKWISVKNNSGQNIHINTFKSEILAVTEAESTVDSKTNWMYPNMSVITDYVFGGMSDDNVYNSSVAWNKDPLYKTQVNYARETPCLLEVYPKYGPQQQLIPNGEFESFRVWELYHNSEDRERKGLEYRKMMRVIAPWITENPILMHVRSAEDNAVKLAIDQCAELGFEKVIMTFGSGFNAEDDSEKNIKRLKLLTEYAHNKGIGLGGYSLLASRRIGNGQDVVMPEGQKPRFGNSPCVESEWGQEYFRKLYSLYEKTAMDNFEHDGSYPGDVCTSEDHPGHTGLYDSQWNQHKRVTDFYKWCRSKGIYLNVPDYYFLNGSNKTGMGYRETNWSLPRAQQEIIERQNIYDGTWNKTPSMGWMFVPLVQYHGGGKEATIEPLKDHLPHYEQRLANLFGAGVQACYRGPRLYDTPETKAIVKKWVDFYKENRLILDADIIHVRRPDGRDYDAILHVNPFGATKGLLMVYNPLNVAIKRKLKLNTYYTGLKEMAYLEYEGGKRTKEKINKNGDILVDIEIPAKSQLWIKLFEKDE